MRARIWRARRTASGLKAKGGMMAASLGIALFPLLGSPALAEDSCVTNAVDAERQLNIPSGLLVAVALVESGQGGVPNPYAISVGNRTMFSRSTAETARHLRGAGGRGRSNVFVGCMQLSLTHHHNQFQPVERIAEPKENVWYAGQMLVRFHGEEGSWRAALARYNGATPAHARGYVCKVWQNLAELNPASAQLLESARCDERRQASVAPITRRAFHDAQVAALN